MNTTVKSKPVLLPTKAKYVGGVMVVLAAISAILIREMHPDIFLKFFWVKPILKFAILLGFMILIVSKEKVEDEFIMQCRNRAFMLAFILGIVRYIINIFIKELGGASNDTVFMMLCYQLPMYLVYFYFAKRGDQ